MQNRSLAKFSYKVSQKGNAKKRALLHLGSMHIGPLTVLPDQQLGQQIKELLPSGEK